ncbi:MAG: hypothetical protein AB1721_01885 [Patescibacteria group bacterium]
MNSIQDWREKIGKVKIVKGGNFRVIKGHLIAATTLMEILGFEELKYKRQGDEIQGRRVFHHPSRFLFGRTVILTTVEQESEINGELVLQASDPERVEKTLGRWAWHGGLDYWSFINHQEKWINIGIGGVLFFIIRLIP